ncbi:MAG: DUF433 domain-containing protein [Longimicrobiaceae bacterium]
MALNTGIYTAGEAASLLHENPRTVRRWAFGSPRTAHGRCKPLIRTELPVLEGERALTFVELVELLYVRAFHQLGVSWGAIREAARVAADLFASPHPFALRQVYLDPNSVLYGAVTESDGSEGLIQLRGHGQQAFPQLVKPYLEQLEFGVDDVAAKWWPMGKEAGVLVDPRIAFGAPIIEGTRIPASTLEEAFLAERPAYGERALERVAWMYEVEPRHVRNALEFSRWLRRA